MDADHNEEEKKENPYQPLRSLTRLLLGGFLVGSEELANRMNTWEETVPDEPPGAEPHAEGDQESEDIESLPDDLPPPAQGKSQDLLEDTPLDEVAIGLLFSAGEKISESLIRISRLGTRITYLASPLTKRLPKPKSQNLLNNTFDKLVKRGEQEVHQLSTMGKQEKVRSKQIFNTASHNTVDDSIDYLTQNKELQELVQQQSTGLAEEIMEELRERAFSLDILIESAVRTTFRLKPRSEIPPPPLEVREHAERLRKKKRA